jgi:hypothetical protein
VVRQRELLFRPPHNPLPLPLPTTITLSPPAHLELIHTDVGLQGLDAGEGGWVHCEQDDCQVQQVIEVDRVVGVQQTAGDRGK